MNTFNEAYKRRSLLFGTEPTTELVDVLKYFPITGKALELGCGDGRDAFHVLKCGLNVTAFDLSQYANREQSGSLPEYHNCAYRRNF